MKPKKYFPTYLIIFITILVIYYLTSAGHTPYDYFVRLADAFIGGKYYLTQNPPWLNELIPSQKGTFFVVHPPLPAILAIPFRLIFKTNFYQEYLSFLIGGLIAVTSFKLAKKVSKKITVAIWTTILTSLGTIVWYLASSGASWYLGQLTAMLFALLALNELFSAKRAFIIGVFLGGAYLSRVNLIVSFPFFLFLLYDKNWKRNFLLLFLGAAPFLGFNFYYNFIRFGTIFDKGYAIIPGVLSEPWYQKGLIHPSYIPRHLKIIFTELPKFQKSFPFVTPSWSGLAIWITTPAFIYSLMARLKEKVTKAGWITILLVSLIIFSHGSTGFTQFGYRFAVDFYPFLILLTIKGVSKKGLKWHHWLLLVLGVLVNLWGVVWINKFGWVGF